MCLVMWQTLYFDMLYMSSISYKQINDINNTSRHCLLETIVAISLAIMIRLGLEDLKIAAQLHFSPFNRLNSTNFFFIINVHEEAFIS